MRTYHPNTCQHIPSPNSKVDIGPPICYYDGITEYGMEMIWTEHDNGYTPDTQVKVYLDELDITSDGQPDRMTIE